MPSKENGAYFKYEAPVFLTNRPTVVKESSETRYVHKSAWTLQGEGVAMVHSVPWVCMSNVWGPQCMGTGEATAGEN